MARYPYGDPPPDEGTPIAIVLVLAAIVAVMVLASWLRRLG